MEPLAAATSKPIDQSSIRERQSWLFRAASVLTNGWVRALILLVIGFAVRMPALQGVPVWDDDYLVGENPFGKSPLLFVEAFRHYLFPESVSLHYRPVQNVSFAVDALVWNGSAYGFHLTNVLLHVASGIALSFLLSRLFRSSFSPSTSRATLDRASLVSFLVALLWIVHPVHSAAVDYISGRADSLAFLFACSAWLFYLRAGDLLSRRARVTYYTGAVLCGLLALCSREIACVWIAIFLLHSVAFTRQRSPRVKVILFVCCIALLATYAGLRHLPDERVAAAASQHWSAPTRVVLMLRALGDYGRLLAWPSTLYMERSVLTPENYLGTTQWRSSAATEYLSVLGTLVLAALVYGAIRKGRARQLRLFGVLWFACGFLPISNLIDLNANVAEHWLYLPSVGLLIFLAGCAVELPRIGRTAAIALSLAASCGLGVRSYYRSSDWVSPKVFYERTMEAGGSSTRVAMNLGLIYQNEGDYGKAEKVFRRVLELTPDNVLARNNLADVLYREGKRQESEALFVGATSLAAETRKENPRTWIAALNLAHIRHNEHDDNAALSLLERARGDYPGVWPIIRFEAELLRKRSGLPRALF
ncbi:MAG: tetratricopeptide repeat protein, partial [Verrucomicrobiota bacterium]|nr:tetratricopeptide repeat protein [Verrucomicrobiota bacterium]